MHPTEESPKLKLTSDNGESPNRLLGEYLHGYENISKTSNKVYAMGKTIAENLE